jgi:hypothetical protein
LGTVTVTAVALRVPVNGSVTVLNRTVVIKSRFVPVSVKVSPGRTLVGDALIRLGTGAVLGLAVGVGVAVGEDAGLGDEPGDELGDAPGDGVGDAVAAEVGAGAGASLPPPPQATDTLASSTSTLWSKKRFINQRMNQ